MGLDVPLRAEIHPAAHFFLLTCAVMSRTEPTADGVSEGRAQTEDLLRRYYAAFDAGDMDTFLSLLTDDVAHDSNQGGRDARRVGKEAFVAFMTRMNECYRERVKDLVVFATADGARGAAEFRIEGTYLVTDAGLPEASGQTYDLPVGAFFEIRDGKVARVTNYYDLQSWLQQVGA